MTPAAPQGWIISRQWDFLFFIGTPLLSLAVLLFAANYFTSADIALFVLAFFAVGAPPAWANARLWRAGAVWPLQGPASSSRRW